MTQPPDPKSWQTFITSVSIGVPRATAARAAGLTDGRLEELLQDEALAFAVDQAEAKAEVSAIAEAKRAAQKGDKAAAAWLRSRAASSGGGLEAAIQVELEEGERPLTAKQAGFLAARLRGLNGTKSARAAGYSGSDSSLSSLAARLNRDPRIARALAKGKAEAEPSDVGGEGTGLENVEPTRSKPLGDVQSPVDAYRMIVNDASVPWGVKMRALKEWQNEQRREEERGQTSGDQKLARLLSRAREVIAEERARERAEDEAEDEPRARAG